MTIARKEAFGNAKTKETSENSKNGRNRNEDLRTNLVQVPYI